MKKKMNVPNKITIFRMLVVVLIIILFLIKEFFPNIVIPFEFLGFTYDWVFISALVLFILGAFSDFLDGHLARKHKIITVFGKFLDPIADKLLVNTMFIILTGLGQIHWLVTVIMVGRDVIVDVIRLIMVERNVVIAASKLGKLKTLMQMTSLILVLLFPLQGATGTFPNVLGNIAVHLTYVAALISLISGIDYFNKNKKVLLEDAVK